MLNYWVIMTFTLHDLVHKVNEDLANGAKCQGGVMQSGGRYYQAMLKEK